MRRHGRLGSPQTGVFRWLRLADTGVAHLDLQAMWMWSYCVIIPPTHSFKLSWKGFCTRCGISVWISAYAVRSVEETLELAQRDIRTATTLIDFRWVAGDDTLLIDLEHGAYERVFEPHLGNFISALEQDTDVRHRNFGGSLYLLEPEVKQGQGGLRDLDIVEWIAWARWGVRKGKDYVRVGALWTREVHELEEAREMLWRVRNFLHSRAGHKQDRLTFFDQEEIAAVLGFSDGLMLGVEQFMQSYYHHARIVSMTAQRILERARPRSENRPAGIHKMADGITVFDGMITLDDITRLEADPALTFRFYHQAIRFQCRPEYKVRDAIARLAPDRHWSFQLQNSEEATQLFLGMIEKVEGGPFRATSTVAELYEVGLLLAMIPEFEPLIGRSFYDAFNVYTADVHAVKSLEYLQMLARGGDGIRSFAVRLAIKIPSRLPVFLATLLHSLGRLGPREPVVDSARTAEHVALRLGLTHSEAAHVAWLVAEQKNLYHWAIERDIHDPATLDEVTRLVQSSERLNDLFLCTVAIMSSVNPQVRTSWKMVLLEALYRAVTMELEAGSKVYPVERRVTETKLHVLVGLANDTDQGGISAFLDEMPNRYFFANSTDVVRRHACIARDRNRETFTVYVGPGPNEDIAELVISTPNRPGLLTDLTAVLGAQALSILSAEIYTRVRDSGDEAFDVFLVRMDKDGVSYDAIRQGIVHDLEERLDGRVSAEKLIARGGTSPLWSTQFTPEITTHVSLDNKASAKYTVIDILTKDRHGLLYEIALTLHQEDLTVDLAKVNTEGDSVADVFYVADAEGRKLLDPTELKKLQKVLCESILQFHRRATQCV